VQISLIVTVCLKEVLGVYGVNEQHEPVSLSILNSARMFLGKMPPILAFGNSAWK
jgi:hypothetical protein